ncbi:hypothetical protein PS659_04686 [Pseudomonas fluorescens]|uniref:Uncharacterized protein n=1 Tax=Pseudomonas fluorescens TaxID=294 RepID=A0A5E6WEQ8_PSEFL|nr:hypothetical protein PS659_04686 [Pseudomonas fluorescens]
MTKNSARLTRNSARMPRWSTSPQAINRMLPAMAGIGMCSISRAPKMANSATHSAEKIPANGEQAPASKLRPERVKEPAESDPEKNAPTTFDKPWARTSWLASSSCWERAEIERAIDRLVTSPSMPTATALGSKRRIRSRSSGNGLKGGNWPTNELTRCTCPNIDGQSQTSNPPRIRVINSVGQRGSSSLRVTPTTTVARPSTSEGRSISPRCLNSCMKLSRAVAWLGKSSPIRFGNWPMAITTAAPRVKPSTTECETKFTRAPKRSNPSSHWKIPASSVSKRINVT